ncbi:MAG: YebC/PmpR family DNA-binding transcriptional regulator [Alphaproteobacteria bacterium]
MAGHSQWKNIMYRKGAQDARRAKLFTKLIRELVVAARSGLPNPATNPRLRNAVLAAKAANMPRETVERSIRRGAGASEGEPYEEIRYEGYGPGGAAIIVEALTDNRNRTAAQLRAAFSKYGGSIGEPGSVSFLFNRVGMVSYPPEVADAEAMFEAALEAGADDCESRDDGHEAIFALDRLGAARDALEARFGPCQSARLTWRPQTTVRLGEEDTRSLLKLIEVLEDNDDVQLVSANFDIADELMARLTT